LREAIIKQICLDIVCISETHLKGNDIIDLDGFKSYMKNRQKTHRRAPKGSGGVAILVKNSVFVNFSVNVIDRDQEGILGIQLTNKETGFVCVVFSCYLPPENSIWGRNADVFFSHLTSQVYMYQEADLISIGGDFNARLGSSQDYVTGVDDINNRVILDNVKSVQIVF